MDKENRNRKITFALAALFVLVVAIVGHIQLLQRQAQTDATVRNASNHEVKLTENLAHCHTLLFDQQSICIRNSYDAYRTAERAEENLTAQQYIAKTGFWLWSIGSIQALVAVFGIYFIARTLDASRAAVAAANRTADEAKRIGEAEVRAYMSVGNVHIVFVSDDGKIVPGIEMKIGNSGNSPARNFEMHMQLAYQTILFDGNIAQEVFLMTENWGPFVSKDERPFSFLFREGPLGQKHIDEMQQRGWPLAVHVTINTSFVDVFDIPIKDSQTFTALYGTFDEISQRKAMTLSPITIDQLVESAKHMTVSFSENIPHDDEKSA